MTGTRINQEISEITRPAPTPPPPPSPLTLCQLQKRRATHEYAVRAGGQSHADEDFQGKLTAI